MPSPTRRESDPIVVRPLTEPDVPAFIELVQALADFEMLPGPDAAARERLARDAVADPPRFQVLLAERGGRAVGCALYFETYSTFLARPTLYLEDLFVLQEERRTGAASALMRELARDAVRRGCGRIEWQVLTWNTSAMDFYRRFGAQRLDAWCGFRLAAEQIAQLAEQG